MKMQRFRSSKNLRIIWITLLSFFFLTVSASDVWAERENCRGVFSNHTGRIHLIPKSWKYRLPLAFILGLNGILFYVWKETEPSEAISPDYLDTVSDPNSPYHQEFLNYEEKEIHLSELQDALPHIALIGDSLCKNFHKTSSLKMIWELWTENQKNPFLDTDPSSDSVDSFFERISGKMPVVVKNYARVSAKVIEIDSYSKLEKGIMRLKHFSGQVESLLRERRFPDLIIIWIGHNDLDWTEGLSPEELKNPQSQIDIKKKAFASFFQEGLQRLVTRAKQKSSKTAIVVFGTVNFDSFFIARDIIMKAHEDNAQYYPYASSIEDSFMAIKKEFRKPLMTLQKWINSIMHETVERFNTELGESSKLRIWYSEELSMVDISDPNLYDETDGFHPSLKGKNHIAECLYKGCQEAINFIAPTP